MQKIFKTIFLLILLNIVPLKSLFAGLVDVGLRSAYTINSNVETGYDDKRGGLLIGANIGLGSYVPIPVFSAIDLSVDYHDVAFSLDDSSVNVVESNIINFSLLYSPLQIIPFITPYIGVGVSFDLGDNLFKTTIFEESVVDNIIGEEYKTDLMNYAFIIGVNFDAFHYLFPISPYIEYRRYFIGIDLMNAAGDFRGRSTPTVESLLIGVEYRF